MTADLFIEGGVTADLARADVLVRDGRIAAIGQVNRPPGCEVLDASGCAIVPGFVNAHAHSGENFNPGLFENLPLDLWFVRSHQVTKTTPATPYEIYIRTLLGAVQMLKTGTTSVGDFLYEAPRITPETIEPVVRAYRDAGLRVTLLLGLSDLPYLGSLPWPDGSSPAGAEARAPGASELIELVRQAVRAHHDPNGLVRVGVGPSAPQRCSDELLDGSMAVARELDLVWHIHALETRSQALTAWQRHGKSFIHALAERGLLNGRTSIVHAVWLEGSDVAVLTELGAGVIHCPASNLRLGDGISPVPALRRRRINVALGTDGRGCFERLDMLELTRLTATLHKVWGQDYREWITASDAMAMATEAGARSLGLEGSIGRLAEGAWADLLLVDVRSATFTPMHDFRRQLVYGGGEGDLRGVMIGGRLVVDRGRIVTVDEETLRREVAALPSVAIDKEDPAAIAMRSRVADLWRECERRPLAIRSYLGPLP